MIFWVTPELREKLYPYLDLGSLFHLAECHKLTRESLKKALIWNGLIRRTFHEDVGILGHLGERDSRSGLTLVCHAGGSGNPSEDDAHLASETPKIRHLSHILSLIQDSPGSHLEMDLIHAVAERYPVINVMHPYKFPVSVDVTCACLQIHQVSPWGFVLLEEIQATLGSREERILEVDTIRANPTGPFLMALSSMASRQPRMEIMIEYHQTELPDWILAHLEPGYVPNPVYLWGAMVCRNRETAEAIEKVARLVHASDYSHIRVAGEIGAKGWTAIRRAVEHLAAPPSAVERIRLSSRQRAMGAGRKEDLKAIWAQVYYWNVYFNGQGLCFTKKDDGERGGWEGVGDMVFVKSCDDQQHVWGVEGQSKGLEEVIDMTEEEFHKEVVNYGGYDSEYEGNEETEGGGEDFE